MYRRHIALTVLIAIITFFCSYALCLDYSTIADVAMTAASIALAVYIAVPSTILGSPYACTLKRERSSEDRTRSLLGVLASYLKFASICAIFSVMLSCVCVLLLNKEKLAIDVFGRMVEVHFSTVAAQAISSLSFASFALTLFYTWLIMKFLAIALVSSAQ